MKLGLKRGTVQLAPYQPEWKDAFAKEALLLGDIFDGVKISIDHLGSTAILGCSSKPIIDIGVIVSSLEDVSDEMKDKLLQFRYVQKINDNFSGNRLFFTKGGEENRTHYLHMGEKGDGYIEKMVKFRDLLNNNPDLVKEYSELKQSLARKHASNRGSYTKEKESFVKKVLESTPFS